MDRKTKINRLFTSLPMGVVLQSFWLKEQGYSDALQQRYRNSHWLDPIGKGAMIRSGDKVGYEGALYALQQQSNLSVHPGGKTALALLGKAHYLSLAPAKIMLFGSAKEKLPIWLTEYNWGAEIDYYASSFLPPAIGMMEVEVKDFTIKVSGAARAIMECLYLAPKKMELMECYELMEGLNNLKPAQVQQLLENCTSVKVKRLFLYLAEKANHGWLKWINLNNVDLGQGKRSIVHNGAYVNKYQITVPKELKVHDEQRL